MLRLWDRAAKCFENQKSTEYLKKPDLRVSTHTLIHTHKHNIILLRPVSIIQFRNNNTVYTLLETPHYIHERSANVSHANLHDNPTTFNQEMVNTFYTSLGKVIMSVFRKSMWYEYENEIYNLKNRTTKCSHDFSMNDMNSTISHCHHYMASKVKN